MENTVSVRLISVNGLYHSKWFISVNNENPFTFILTRYPKETKENLLKEIKALPEINQSTISALDQKSRLHLY